MNCFDDSRLISYHLILGSVELFVKNKVSLITWTHQKWKYVTRKV